MSAFAGSRNQSQRRRRLLAHEDQLNQEEDSLESGDLDDVRQQTAVDVSVSQLVPQSFWWHVPILLIAHVICGWLVWTGIGTERVLATTGLLLLGAAQFAFLVGWVRSHSELDFQGRYRWWRWFAIGIAAVSLLKIGRLENVFADGLVSLLEPFTGSLNAARPAILFGVVATYSLLVLRKVLPDMGRSMVSQGLVVVAVILQVTHFSFQYGSTVEVPETVLLSLQLFAACELFCGLLLHSRYVIYVNHHPPERRQTHHTMESTIEFTDTMAPQLAEMQDDAFTESDVGTVAATADPVAEETESENDMEVVQKTTAKPAQSSKRKRKSKRRRAA